MGVRMRNPNLEQEIEVTPSAVPFHKAAGWEEIPGQDEQGEQWPEELQPFEGQQVVRLRHPDVADEIRVAESAVPFHRSKGWLLVEDDVSAEVEPEKPARRRRGQQQEAGSAEAAEQTSKEA